MEKPFDENDEPEAKKVKLNTTSEESEYQDAYLSKVPTDEISSQPSTSSQNLPAKGDEREDNTIEEKVLRETDVGISEYISEHEGFSGIIKQRYVFLAHVNINLMFCCLYA